MGNNYKNKHQGLIAYLMLQGHPIIDIEIRDNRIWFEVDLPFREGREIANQFFDHTATVDPYNYSMQIGNLRTKLFEFKKTHPQS